ncbi:hypothetical protein FSP39_012274 [Pinctada imbricata]|uniref:Tyrosinase copper-binding domain-containing protein n=1 Tax=Pinctada imbricata TaxID=66713 RepID=A0AA88XIM2_PINIB|nr:hypothetical protein FSP39_012274 [Pinctada imbricata]
MIEEIPVPKSLENCFSRYAAKTSISKTVGQSINWICVHQYTWAMNGKRGWMPYNITADVNRWFGSLLQFTKRRNVIRFRRQTNRGRKEIRAMSEKEKYNFFRAVNLLKADRSVYPNRYDAISALHQGITEISAHGGPNFLGWHRVYLTMFENALREYIPSVTLPYWDSTLDDKMANPANSIIWTKHFFGNGNGIVNSGPFANWMTPSGPLIRNIGNGGQLFRTSDIRRVLSRRRVMEITEPLGPTATNLEFHHGEVHLYVEGQMSDLTTASHDPLFYLHHCYVDYIWELFRKRQRMMGINPERDYPIIVNHTLHTANAPLGLGALRNRDSFKNSMIAGIYHYESSPHCSARRRSCGSPYLTCGNIGREWTCISNDKSTAPADTPTSSMANGMTTNDMNMLRNIQNLRRIQSIQESQNLARSRGRLNMNRNMISPKMGNNPNIDLSRILKVNNIDPNIMIPVLSQTNGNVFSRRFMNSRVSQNMSPGEIAMPINVKGGGNMMVSVHRDRSNPNNFEIHQVTMNTSVGSGFSQMQGQVQIQNPSQAILASMGQQVPSGAQQQIRPQQSANKQQNKEDSCPAIPVNQPFQNTFNINGRSDTRQWVYMPVNIVYRRPPEYKMYNSFAIYNSKPFTTADIYAPAAYKMTKTRLEVESLASYRFCNTGKSGAGAVFIQSNGINYIGNYKEYSIVDHRMAISMSTAFVAVKNPQLGVTEVLLSAYDSCGRVCRPFCKDPKNPSAMRRCSGMLRINSQHPKFYGHDYGEAVYNAWNLQDPNCPHLDNSNIYVTFYCDYEESWPLPGTVPAFRPQQMTIPMQIPMPIPGIRFSQTVSTSIVVCKLRNGCIVRDRCTPCIHGTTRQCEKTCSLYAKCVNGFYQTSYCVDGQKFNPMTGKCEIGICPEEETPPPLNKFLPTTPAPVGTRSKVTPFDD